MYQVENPINKAMGGMDQAAGTYGRMMRKTPEHEKPDPTVGGSLMAGVGGATATAALAGTEMGAAAMGAMASNPVTLGVGAAIGIGAYLFS